MMFVFPEQMVILSKSDGQMFLRWPQSTNVTNVNNEFIHSGGFYLSLYLSVVEQMKGDYFLLKHV